MELFKDHMVFVVAILLLACPLLQVAKCLPGEATKIEGSNDLGYVGSEAQEFGDTNLALAPAVDTFYTFPKNNAHLVTAGENTVLLVGIKNDGESRLNVIGIRASLHIPYDHSLLVQNLTSQAFNNATVPASSQATFPCIFAVSKYLQSGTFDLEGVITYEVDQKPFQRTFFNGTIEVADSSGFLTMETLLLVTFGVASIGIIGLWVHAQISNLSKKSKKPSKVEVGTVTNDASLDEWLQGTSFAQSAKAKKNK